MESDVIRSRGVSRQVEFNISSCSSNHPLPPLPENILSQKVNVSSALKDIEVNQGRRLSLESICLCKPNYFNSFILQNLFPSPSPPPSPALLFSSPVPTDRSDRGSQFTTLFTSELRWECIFSGN